MGDWQRKHVIDKALAIGISRSAAITLLEILEDKYLSQLTAASDPITFAGRWQKLRRSVIIKKLDRGNDKKE